MGWVFWSFGQRQTTQHMILVEVWRGQKNNHHASWCRFGRMRQSKCSPYPCFLTSIAIPKYWKSVDGWAHISNGVIQCNFGDDETHRHMGCQCEFWEEPRTYTIETKHFWRTSWLCTSLWDGHCELLRLFQISRVHFSTYAGLSVVLNESKYTHVMSRVCNTSM